MLGAGGARGLAQIGVIEALQARDFDIVTVAGSSSGALVGGIFAAGKLAEFREQLERMGRGDFMRLLDPAIGQAGLLHGERLVHAMREVVGDPADRNAAGAFHRGRGRPAAPARSVAAQRPAVGCDPRLVRDPGAVHPAHRAWPRTGRWRPAGAVADRGHAPVRRASADRGRHAWLAATAARRAGADNDIRRAHESLRTRFRRLDRTQARQWPAATLTSALLEVMSRSLDTMQAQISRVQLALDPPELVIRIPRDACLFYEFWRAKELIAIGRSETDKALDAAGY